MTKYKARKVELDGYKFDSIAEANHYKYIILPMLQAGKIQNLVVHPKFPCVVNGKKICTYIADFEFEIKKLSNANSVLALKLEDKILRRPASVEPVDPKNDLVELKTYRWGFNQLLASARDYFSKKDFIRYAWIRSHTG